MPVLPVSLLEHLAGGSLAAARPAWFLVGPDGTVLESGGDLATHGLEGLAAGRRAADVVPFVDEGFAGRRLGGLLPRVQTAPERFADVHVVPGDEGVWVLLLDATAKAREAADAQQRSYDLALDLDERHRRDFKGVLEALDVLVLRETPNGRYRVLGAPPAWSRPWVGGRSSLNLVETWPFLDSFLPEAAGFCSAGRDGTLRSGPWVETLPDGQEVSLEAKALRTEQRGCLLLVERLGERHRERQKLMQRAREQGLAHERLMREIEKKEVLLHCVVHDLNGPLTAMMGCLDLLANTDQAPEDARRLGELGSRQARRQARLIKNILEVYAADVGAMSGEERPDGLDVAGCAREVAEEYEPVARRKEVRLELDLGAGASRPACAEGARLFRVLANLLDNALRHTPRGGTARLGVLGEEDGLAVLVENDGNPVPEELVDRLFDKFTRSRESGGAAGLGLFFCKSTVERWGGSIAYEPREEGGVRFRIRLPYPA